MELMVRVGRKFEESWKKRSDEMRRWDEIASDHKSWKKRSDEMRRWDKIASDHKSWKKRSDEKMRRWDEIASDHKSWKKRSDEMTRWDKIASDHNEKNLFFFDEIFFQLYYISIIWYYSAYNV